MNFIKLLITAAVLVCGLAIAVAQVSPSAQVNRPPGSPQAQAESPWAKMNKSADCDPPLAQVYRPTECESPVAHATK